MSGREPGTVFVVDDDASVRKSLVRLLKSAGYAAESFASAAELLHRQPFDEAGCVVLDVRMPGMDGLELQEHLATLTPRELQVLRHLLSGQTNKRIAADLGTAEKTVKIQRGRVMKKMEAASLAHRLRMAAQAGVRPE